MEHNGELHNLVAVRLIEDRLAWYPPGAGDLPRFLEDDVAREQLRAALAQRRGNICFAVPGNDVRLLVMELSAEEKKHISGSLAFLLEDQVAADIDTLHFAARPLGKLGLSVAVCSQQCMERWRELLTDFPGLSRWSPEPLLLPWQTGEWCLVLDGDMAIFRFDDSRGLSIERDMFPAVAAELLAEGDEPEAVIVYGQSQAEDIALLPEPVRERAQWRRGGLGAALLLADSSANVVNLLQGEYAPRLPLARWWRQWKAVAVVFGVAFVLQLLATYVDYYKLQRENLDLRGAMQDSYRRANPDGAAPEPEKQLQRQLDAMRGTSQSSGFVSLMERVGAVIAQRPGTSIASVNYSDRAGEMRMNILAADFESVEAIRSGINNAGLQAEMESSNTQGDQVRARIRVGEKS
jgi:type II secretion system protein L